MIPCCSDISELYDLTAQGLTKRNILETINSWPPLLIVHHLPLVSLLFAFQHFLWVIWNTYGGYSLSYRLYKLQKLLNTENNMESFMEYMTCMETEYKQHFSQEFKQWRNVQHPKHMQNSPTTYTQPLFQHQLTYMVPKKCPEIYKHSTKGCISRPRGWIVFVGIRENQSINQKFIEKTKDAIPSVYHFPIINTVIQCPYCNQYCM